MRRLVGPYRRLALEARDVVLERLWPVQDEPRPPRWLRDVGPGDFEATGREFLRHFVELGGLRPNDAVLEIGCGPGRMALPLTRYLGEGSLYVGVDVVAPAIRWCRRNVTRRHPRFRFVHADIENARYNPSGRFKAREYRFPFEAGSFDFVFLTSVFTHMRPEEMEHYLLEIARLLRSSGRVLCTFFLLNAAQRALAARGRTRIDFQWDHGDFSSRDENVPESAIAVHEDLVRDIMARAGLVLVGPVRYGSWTGREDGLSLQDIVVACPGQKGPARRK
jgi:SAM-dependent methyltransferase